MQLERLSVRLRPRGGWEALDLGFHMARSWWRPVWGTWLAVFVPAALLLHLVFLDYPWLAMALLWWLKPAFDRFVLHVVSRAVFGAPPTVRETLGAWRQVLSPGLIAGLTLQRLSLARSFTLAVPQLEHQTGAAGRARRTALGKRMRGYAVWLTSACAMFEGFLILALAVLLHMLAPGISDTAPDLESLFGGRGEEGAWNWANSALWVLAICVMEPFYVAAGFSLYLNRRSILEGWDIELQLRRLDERLQRAASPGHGVTALFAAVLAAGALAFPPGVAEAAGKSPKEEIREVLKQPELNPYREEMRWQLRQERREEPPARDRGRDWGDFGKFLATVVQSLAWIAVAMGIAAVLWYAWKHLRVYLAAPADAWKPPEALFGLAVAPESLPRDVAGTAAALAREGRIREALSLLYRGALSVLVHRERVRLVEGDTEGDTLRAARKVLPEGGAEYFASLVRAWVDAAYADRLPDAAGAELLARSWTPHFARPAAERPGT